MVLFEFAIICYDHLGFNEWCFLLNISVTYIVEVCIIIHFFYKKKTYFAYSKGRNFMEKTVL